MRKRNVIILLLLFAVLLGCYLYISHRPAKKSADDGQKKIVLANYDGKKINKITLKSDKGNLELNRSGDKWIANNDGSIKVDNVAVEEIANSFAGLTADKMLEESPKELEQYGLNPAAVTATAKLGDGSEKVVLLGSRTPEGKDYYMMVNGDPKLYLLPNVDGDRFSYVLGDIRDKSVFAAEAASVNYIKITLPDGTSEELKKVAKGDPEAKQYNEGTWIMTKPFGMAYKIDDQKISEPVNAVASVKADKIVSENQSDLKKYGLDKPALDITAKAGTSTVHFLVSKKDEESNVYFKLVDSNLIYRASSSSMYDALNKQPMDLILKIIYLVNIDDVDQIAIDASGKHNIITFKREKKPAAKQGEADQVVTTYTVNGKNIEESAFKKFYQSVIGVMAESQNDKTITGSSDVKVTYTLNKGAQKQVVVEYRPYNADFYAAFVNGKSDFLTSRTQVQTMLDNMNNLMK